MNATIAVPRETLEAWRVALSQGDASCRWEIEKILQQPDGPADTVQFSQVSDPSDWSPKDDFDALTFGSYTDAKKAEVLFNRLQRERDEAMKYGHEWRLKAALAKRPEAGPERYQIIGRMTKHPTQISYAFDGEIPLGAHFLYIRVTTHIGPSSDATPEGGK